MRHLFSWFIVSLLLLPKFGFADETTSSAKVPPPAKIEAPESWNKEQKSVIAFLEALFVASRSVNSTGKERAASRERILSALDWSGVARGCLGDAVWKKENPKNRSAFADGLRDVVSLTAFSRLDTFWDGTTYTFKKIEITKDKAVVDCVFKANDEDYTLTYYLKKGSPDWHIEDLAYEGLVYSKQINEQISFFLKDQSFSALLGKLKKRKADLLEDEASPKKKK